MAEQMSMFPDNEGQVEAEHEIGPQGEPSWPPTDLSARATLDEALEEFDGAMLLKGFTDNTIKAFQADLRILTEFIAPNRHVAQISTKDLQDFLAYLLRGRGRPCNAKSYARRITTLKVFFGWLTEAGVLRADPAAPIVHKPVRTPLPRVLSDGEAQELLAAGRRLAAGDDPDARPLLLAELLLQTGIKKGECMGIHLSHLDLTNPAQPLLHVRYEQVRQRYKERTIQLKSNIVPLVRAYRAQYQPLEHLFECTARNLEYVLRDLAQLAGIAGGVSFESLRWTAALSDFRAGATEEALRRKLGLSRLRWRETVEKLQQLSEPAL